MYFILTQNIFILIQISFLSNLNTDLSLRFPCQDISEHCLVQHITSSVQPLILMSVDLPNQALVKQCDLSHVKRDSYNLLCL